MIFAIIIGLILVVIGILTHACNDDIIISVKSNTIRFDPETLGVSSIIFGALLAVFSGLAKLIVYAITTT